MLVKVNDMSARHYHFLEKAWCCPKTFFDLCIRNWIQGQFWIVSWCYWSNMLFTSVIFVLTKSVDKKKTTNLNECVWQSQTDIKYDKSWLILKADVDKIEIRIVRFAKQTGKSDFLYLTSRVSHAFKLLNKYSKLNTQQRSWKDIIDLSVKKTEIGQQSQSSFQFSSIIFFLQI